MEPVKPRSQHPRYLLDQSVRGEEDIVLGGQLLHLLLVLAQLLEVISGHCRDTISLGLASLADLREARHRTSEEGCFSFTVSVNFLFFSALAASTAPTHSYRVSLETLLIFTSLVHRSESS